MRSAALLLLAACSTAPPPPPAPRVAATCSAELRLAIDPRGPERELRVIASNPGPTAVDLVLPDRCPKGPIDVSGLPPGYDLYGTCNAGPCPGARRPQQLHLEPGEERVVSSARIALAGRAPCTRALAPGRHELTPVPPDPAFCMRSSWLDVPGSSPSRPPPPRQPSPRPPPAARAPVPADYACTAPADCVLSCPDAPGCCGYPCGCRHAIRRDRAAAHAASYAASCDRPPCPAVGCAYEPAFGATCRDGRCVAVDGPGGF